MVVPKSKFYFLLKFSFLPANARSKRFGFALPQANPRPLHTPSHWHTPSHTYTAWCPKYIPLSTKHFRRNPSSFAILSLTWAVWKTKFLLHIFALNWTSFGKMIGDLWVIFTWFWDRDNNRVEARENKDEKSQFWDTENGQKQMQKQRKRGNTKKLEIDLNGKR